MSKETQIVLQRIAIVTCNNAVFKRSKNQPNPNENLPIDKSRLQTNPEFILVIVIIMKRIANNSHSGSNFRKLGFDLVFMFLERTKFEMILIE